MNLVAKRSNTMDPQKSSTFAPAQPMSPKSLTPLVIPAQSGALPRLARQLSLTRLRSGSNPSESINRLAKPDESPKSRTPFTPFTPFTPASSFITTPKSAVTASTLPTPISAPVEVRESPRPWEKAANNTTAIGTPDLMSTPRAAADAPRSATSLSHRIEFEQPPKAHAALSHRRNQSDTGSIMERGRPRKRCDGSSVGVPLRRTLSKRSKSAERRAFEALPQGWKPSEAVKMMDADEVAQLQKQAFGQAARFEILKKDQVESLSKVCIKKLPFLIPVAVTNALQELRQLDERTEYLRRTYTSLRAGRRNLHSRICQYLRSPRVAKFSYESMLKQEEALAELDASIDDWVSKLEQAENRRTRVRQKLLEHVAAAATLAIPASDIIGTSESLQQTIGIRASSGPTEVTTPPRSPTKAEAQLYAHSPSPSPQRVVARVPSVIAEIPAEECAAGLGLNEKASDCQSALARMESIRIYADSDVYALLADVETEFTKLSGVGHQSPDLFNTEDSDEKRRELHRAHSHELLNGTAALKTADKTPPMSPPAPTPPMKDSPGDEIILLTSAVFQPTPVSVV